MKQSQTDTLIRILPVAVTGLIVNRNIIRTADNELIFDNVIIALFIILFAGTLVWTFIKDKNAYKRTRLKASFIPTGTGMLIIASFFITDAILAARDKSPILIQAGYDGGYNGTWFEFRKDGTYKFANSSGIGATYFRGKYTLSDSLITLDRDDIDNVIQSRLLAIRETSTSDRTEHVIYQINPQHQVINNEFKFIIHIDNNK